jgi:hypothetical protein
MLDFDMLASPNYARFIYDAFTTGGIPAGGIFAGAEVIKQPYQVALYGGTAGVPFDVCYHQLCDRLTGIKTNINELGLSEHSMRRFTRSSRLRRLNPR